MRSSPCFDLREAAAYECGTFSRHQYRDSPLPIEARAFARQRVAGGLLETTAALSSTSPALSSGSKREAGSPLSFNSTTATRESCLSVCTTVCRTHVCCSSGRYSSWLSIVRTNETRTASLMIARVVAPSFGDCQSLEPAPASLSKDSHSSDRHFIKNVRL